MINKLASVTLLSLFLMIRATTALAADGVLVSGPKGTQNNGWFSSNPTIRVDTVPSCSSGPSGDVSMIIISEEGQHHITLRSHHNTYPRIYRDDDTNGHGTSNEVFTCPSVSTPYDGSDPVVFWETDIKWDATPPIMTLTTPTNNSNTETSTVMFTGTVSDTTSGVWKVLINGTNASIVGNGFSANVPVSNGLNTLTVTAYDLAGNTSVAQVVVNRIASLTENVSIAGPEVGSGSPTAQESTTVEQVSENSPEDSNSETKKETSDPAPVPVQVAVVGASGVGLASFLGYIPYKKIGLLVSKLISK